MNFKFLISLMLTATALTAAADGTTHCLRVGLTDGSQSYYAVADGLEWHTNGTTLTIHTASADTPYSYEIAGVASLGYENVDFSAVDSPEAATAVTRLTADGVVIEGAPDGSRCLVSDLQGRTLADRRFDGTVTIGGLAPGTYLVTVNGRETLKIAVK